MSKMTNFLNIERKELTFSLSMLAYFFLVITSFWIYKPLKKSLFVEFYTTHDLFSFGLSASQTELLAKTLNLVIAIIAVAVFSKLSKKYARQNLTLIFSSFFIICNILFSFFLNTPSSPVVWLYYLYGDLYSTLMVATFFAFLNDAVTPESSRRLYGLVGFGGVLGGVFGTTFVRVLIDNLSSSQWMYICIGILILIILFSQMAEKFSIQEETGSNSLEDKTVQKNELVKELKVILGNSYLLGIVSIVGIYEIVSTLMDFQFTSTVIHYLSGSEIGKQFSTVYAITNYVSMFIQFFLTSFVMTRFGVKAALLVLPMTCLLSSVGYLAMPILTMGSLLCIADNAFSYSINQSAKESLYVPLSKTEKYQAKAFIDIFIMRFAKVVAIGMSLGISYYFGSYESVRWLSLIVVVLIALWVYLAMFCGNKYTEICKE